VVNNSYPTEEIIGQYCTEGSIERGYEYFQDDAVLWVVQRGSKLFSEVQGSECHPYCVCVTLEGCHTFKAHCTCPYDWGGYCKHVVATLLVCIHDQERVSERPTIAATLAEFSREQLQGLVLELSEQRPDLTNLIESLALDSQEAGHSGLRG
jgi:uncharacterized Zn finger protein